MTTEPESLRASLPKSDEPDKLPHIVLTVKDLKDDLADDFDRFHYNFCPANLEELSVGVHRFYLLDKSLYTSPSPDSRNDVIRSVSRLEAQFEYVEGVIEMGGVHYTMAMMNIRDIAAAMKEALEALKNSPPPPPGWVKCEERMPPNSTEVLVGRWVRDEWRICQSGFYFDQGNEMEGELSSWYWCCDFDRGGVTDDEGPSHWMPLPIPPKAQ